MARRYSQVTDRPRTPLLVPELPVDGQPPLQAGPRPVPGCVNSGPASPPHPKKKARVPPPPPPPPPPPSVGPRQELIPRILAPRLQQPIPPRPALLLIRHQRLVHQGGQQIEEFR